MWSNKSNEVPLQNPRHNQNKDSTRGMDFCWFIVLFWKMFYNEVFETSGSFSRRHSPALVWKIRPCVGWLPFCNKVVWYSALQSICWSTLGIASQGCQDGTETGFSESCRGGAVQEQKSRTVGSRKKSKEPESCSWLLLPSKVVKTS